MIQFAKIDFLIVIVLIVTFTSPHSFFAANSFSTKTVPSTKLIFFAKNRGAKNLEKL